MIIAASQLAKKKLLATAIRFGPALDTTRSSSSTLVLSSSPRCLAPDDHQHQHQLLPHKDPSSSIRYFHSSTPLNKNRKTFRPRRRPPSDYRPVKPGPKKVIDTSPGNDHKFVELKGDDSMKAPLGPVAQSIIENTRRERQRLLLNQIPYDDTVEEEMRMMDYLLAEDGSLEERMGERRLLSRSTDTEEERREFLEKMDQMVKDGNLRDLGMDHEWEKKMKELETARFRKKQDKLPFPDPTEKGGSLADKEEYDPETYIDPNQLAFGDWSEMLINVDRNIKLWRGGRLESYRALVIGGNLNGCGGFGHGKAKEPIEAVAKASRQCKRNIFFVEAYQGDSLTRDLVGTQNSCKVVIRQTYDGELRGNPLSKEILKRFGIVNAQIKAYGRRTPYNVVQATFKALMTHESLEEIAMKRGKRLVSLERAMRLKF